jgi:AraC-like DNA-binding protein
LREEKWKMQNRKGKKNAAQLLDPMVYSKIATTMLQKDYRDRMEGDTPELYRLERMSRKMGVTRQTFYRYLSQDTAKPQLDLFVSV